MLIKKRLARKMLKADDYGIFLDLLDKKEYWNKLAFSIFKENEKSLSKSIELLANKILNDYFYEIKKNSVLPKSKHVTVEDVFLYESLSEHNYQLIASIWYINIHEKL